MSSWQSTPNWPARLGESLIIGSLIVLTVIFFWSPQTLDRFVDLFKKQTAAPVIATPDADAKTAEQPVVKKTVKQSRGGSNPRTAIVSESDSVIQTSPNPIPNAPPKAQSDSSQASVKTEAAAVYSTNSSRSPVVRVLKKGDRVESDLEVIDSKGRWSLLRTNEVSLQGFVRSENLERQQTTVAKEQTPN